MLSLSAQLEKARTQPFDSSHRFATSWLLPPAVLFFARALLSLYAFTTTFFNLGWNGTHGGTAGQSFSYFTNLTYWGLSFYFAVSAVHTGTYWLTGEPLLAKWPRTLQWLHSIFYSTVTVFPFIVTIVYWSILFSGVFSSEFAAWSNVSVHAMNSAFALFEIVIPRTAPQPWIHIVPLTLLLALYLALAYVTYATQHFYVYSFLNDHLHSHGVVAGYCFGILIGMVIIFTVVHFLIKLRILVTEKVLGLEGKRSLREQERQATNSEEGYMEMELESAAVHAAVKDRMAAETQPSS